MWFFRFVFGGVVVPVILHEVEVVKILLESFVSNSLEKNKFR